jgi:hypothetical protein
MLVRQGVRRKEIDAKLETRENSLSAVFVNWFGAIIPLLYQKLPGQNAVRNSLEEKGERLAPYVGEWKILGNPYEGNLPFLFLTKG